MNESYTEINSQVVENVVTSVENLSYIRGNNKVKRAKRACVVHISYLFFCLSNLRGTEGV